MWWQPAHLLWSKIWRGLGLEIKAFQVCIWTGSILIRLDIHQIGDYGHLDRVQQSRDIHQMNDADAENIEGLKKFDEDDHPHEYGAESDDEYINFDKDDEKC